MLPTGTLEVVASVQVLLPYLWSTRLILAVTGLLGWSLRNRGGGLLRRRVVSAVFLLALLLLMAMRVSHFVGLVFRRFGRNMAVRAGPRQSRSRAAGLAVSVGGVVRSIPVSSPLVWSAGWMGATESPSWVLQAQRD